jgi:hypothetical protein
MALAEAGRHEDALQLYPTAIEAQQKCWQRMPDAMDEALSKMYYNYGQSLRQTGRLVAASKAAMERREVWKGNGERLFGVAVELAELARLTQSDASTDDTNKLHDEIVAILAESRDAGFENEVKLAKDERFAFLRKNEQFEQLIATRGRRSPADNSQTSENPPTPHPTKN